MALQGINLPLAFTGSLPAPGSDFKEEMAVILSSSRTCCLRGCNCIHLVGCEVINDHCLVYTGPDTCPLPTGCMLIAGATGSSSDPHCLRIRPRAYLETRLCQMEPY